MSSQEITDQSRRETFEFTGRRGPFFRLLLVNLILTILTLGIYRFWAKTNVRRFIWSNIRFLGDPLEYTGKGSELLLGFLIVLAVLFPLGLVYEAIQSLAPPDETALRVGLEVLYYITIFALIQIGFYRAWRYRMSRTAWRGIRLGLDGSTWTFLKLSLGWTVLTVLTLGLAYPWMAVELWRYQITHTRIGQTAAEFTGTGRDLIFPWICVLGPFLILFVALSMSIYLSGAPINVVIREVVIGENNDPILSALLVASAISYLATPVAWLWYTIRLLQYQVSGTSIAKASVSSRLPEIRLIIFAALSIILVLLPTVFVGAAIYVSSGLDDGSLIIFAILGVVAGLVLFPLVWTMVFTFELIKQLFIQTTVDNPKNLEIVIQSASDSQKTGEGLADAFDIGGL